MDGTTGPSFGDLELKRWRFTASDVQRMHEAGILPDKARLELIHGELIEMPSEGPPHWSAKQRLVDWFYRRLPLEVALAPDGPLRLSELEEPEPDFFLFPASMDVNDVRGADTLLVVEVADSSIRKDRVIKAPIYAAHGVSEYWIVNIVERKILVHCTPLPKGYASVEDVAFDTGLAPRALVNLLLQASDIL